MARIDAFLESLERPEQILPQLIRELADKVNDAVNAEAKSLTAVKAAQRRLDEATGRALRFEKGAAQAVLIDDIETARQALAAQIESEKMVEKNRKILDASSAALLAARQTRTQLQKNLKELRSRKNHIISRSRQADIKKTTISSHEKINVSATDNILDAVSRIEAKIDLDEATLEVQNDIARTIDPALPIERIEQFENNAEINRRLDLLRKNSKNQSQ